MTSAPNIRFSTRTIKDPGDFRGLHHTTNSSVAGLQAEPPLLALQVRYHPVHVTVPQVSKSQLVVIHE